MTLLASFFSRKNVQKNNCPSDDDIITLVKGGNTNAFEIIMRRYNQRLYRVVRSIVKNEHEAEDIIQETYIKAYTKLYTLDKHNYLGAWLSKIAINGALMRIRQRQYQSEVSMNSDETEKHKSALPQMNPERMTGNGQLKQILESAIDTLPEDFRLVFVLRAIEQLSVSETAQYLDIKVATVKTRFFRAKNMMKKKLQANIDVSLLNTFEFGGTRCNRIVEHVLPRLSSLLSN